MELFPLLIKKQRVATLKNLKYKTCFQLFHTFLPSVRIYNVNSHENKKETQLNEKVCPNFWPVLYITHKIAKSTDHSTSLKSDYKRCTLVKCVNN